MPRGVKGSAPHRGQLEELLEKHGNLRAVGKELGIGDSIYTAAARVGLRSPLGEPKAMAAHKRRCDPADVRELLAMDMSVNQIAGELEVNPSTVYRALKPNH